MKLQINYRPHRGGFDESLKEVQLFDSVSNMRRALDKNGDGVSIAYYAHDDRIDAETFIVTDDRSGNLGFMWFTLVEG